MEKTTADLFAELVAERKAKNYAYAFILANGLQEAFRDFRKEAEANESNPHALAVAEMGEAASGAN